MPFQKGQSGNPKGRPRGSRQKLTEAVLKAYCDDFAEHGIAVVEKVRTDDPATYLRVVASMLPKELEATVRHVDAKELSDNELADIAVGSSEGTAEPALDSSQLN